MDRNEAIRAHIRWKMGLSSYLKHPDGSQDPGEVERVDTCDLGEWIEGEGEAQFSTDMAFRHLKAAHDRFHHRAADIVRRANDGQEVTDQTALGAHSGLAAASSDVVTSLMALPLPTGGRRAEPRRVLAAP